ncbi:MAG TPA: hypothetical protein VKV05_07445 [Terriglobales bacterium]|nr:hypothetical protein [Terriglobales bacterium]
MDCSGISQVSTGDGPPPDTNAAVGDSQVVEFVNNSYQVFDKTTGAPLTQPIDDKELFQSLPGGSACKIQDGGDVIVDFDKTNHVWLLAYNIGSPIGPGNTYPLCVAVSTSPDATGSYYAYQYPLGIYFADYPKWAMWPTGYFQTNDNGTYGPLVCAYNGAKMRAGDGTAEQICRRFTPRDFHLLPADADSAPPASQDEFFIGSMGVQHEPTCPGTGYNSLYLYSMHPVFSNPTQTTFTGIGLANPICVPSYSPYLSQIPQEGTSKLLDSLGNASMFRFAYWNDGALYYGGMQHWHMNHTVQAASGQAGVRWYEFEAIERPATLSSVYLLQSGTFAPDSNYRWMGSTAQDKLGDTALGYSESSAQTFPSIYVTGRVLSDPSGGMEGEVLLWAGTASQTTSSRWGDYSSMAIDGSDGCTFWYAQEYYDATAPTYWQTRLVAFTFNNCQ